MLQFFLVRLRGAFHLLHKLQALCENAGDHSLMRLNLGHFWNVGLVHMALLARLWYVFFKHRERKNIERERVVIKNLVHTIYNIVVLNSIK